MKPPKAPPPRPTTTREALREALLVTRETGAAASARDLAAAASISEKDVAEHLEHLARSLPRDGLKLEVNPASCLACGFAFTDRARLTAPSACPSCRSERVAPPTFAVKAGPTKPAKPAARPRARPEDDEDDDGGDDAD